METCRDCLHYEVCQYHIAEETDMTINECSYGFKNKADFVEVIRCADCNNYEPYTIHTGWCNEHSRNVLDNNYCGFAERKDAE